MPQPLSGGRPSVVVVGAGFGGLWAARALGGKPVDVVLIDRNNYHCFTPLLYQVATAGLEPDAIAHPVRAIVRRHHNVRFVMTDVKSVDLEKQSLVTTEATFNYDFLILASGSATNFFGMDSLRVRGFELKAIDHAIDIRNHILTQFEKAAIEMDQRKRSALLTFCIVGGGPTGVEFAGALSELIRLVLVKDYPGLDLSAIRIVLLETGDSLLQAFPKRLQEAARKVLVEDKGVQVAFGARVVGMDDGQVLLQDGASIPSHTLVWAAGVRSSLLVDSLGVPLARQQRVPTEPTLQISGHPRAFVVGDALHLEQNGQPLPMVAQVGMQSGVHAASNVMRSIRGEALRPFVYKDKGNLATIGRNAAVADIGRFQFTGFPAWVVWLTVHLVSLIGFRNRLLALINWAWDYFFYDRAIRIITRREAAKP